MSEKRLFLIDAYALIFRAYYAFISNPRINSKGLNTSAIFGFTLALEELLRKEKPTHLAVVFDPPRPTFRHQIFPDYKANRDETPEVIRQSVPIIKKLIQAFRFPVIEVEGFEADDVIGTLAKKAEKQHFISYLMTSDKDYCQLVSENIFVYKPKRSGSDIEILGVKEVLEKFEIEKPEQVIDILALWGDSADNIPGVPGIGEKTAKKLISSFKSVENIIENVDKLNDKQRISITANRELLLLSKKLTTIVTDVNVDFNDGEFLVKQPDIESLSAIFKELEFVMLSTRILKSETVKSETKIIQTSLFDDAQTKPENLNYHSDFQNINNTEHQYYLCDTNEKIENLAQTLDSLPEFCFDTETTGLELVSSELVGISFSFKNQEAYYVPISQNQVDAKNVLSKFKAAFENEQITKIGQNLKFDIQMLKNYDIQVKGKFFDTMVAHYLIQPDQKHNMDFLSETYLKYKPVAIEELIGEKGKNQGNMRNVEVNKIKEYAAEDADITWQLKTVLEKELENFNAKILFDEIEMPLISVLAEMEYTCVKINAEVLNNFKEELNNLIINLEDEIYLIAGHSFNISSPKQLGIVLFNELKISDNPGKTKTKQFATGEEELQKLAGFHPIVGKILEYRSLKKLLSAYVEALPKMVNAKTNKIHTSFNQTIAATGRLSSNNPNLQNIPVKTENGREIRKAFISTDEQYVFFSADYSQIELRIMAHFSDDNEMISAFLRNEDIHTATASKIYKIPNEDVTREMRNKAKVANFGIIYGISSFGLAQRLNISRTESKQLIDNYFLTFPQVKIYIEKSIEKARKSGFVETMFGRRRYLPDINSNNATVRGFAERNAINAPIQGTAADIIKIAMIRIQQKFEQLKLQSKMIIQVHDELDFDVYIRELEQVKTIVTNEMEHAAKLKVPLIVETGTGNNWFEAH